MQQHKVSMGKRKFRIGDLAKELKVKKYVVRFWEKEFDLDSDRSEGGQRFYTKEDFQIFSAIKDLLYNRGFTISGAKKELTSMFVKVKLEQNQLSTGQDQDHVIGATKEHYINHDSNHDAKKEFLDNLEQLRKDLEKLYTLLR